jgi:hypothetical protein
MPSPVQRDIVQSASAPRLYFVRLGNDSYCEKLWCVVGMALRYMSAT